MTTADPRHWTDARTAADAIVAGFGHTASADVVRAVLAQWICESGWSYPPKWNNPGNNALGWAQATGYPFTTPVPNPQPTDPIVAYPDEWTGVHAYAKGFLVIRRSDGSLKYDKAVKAAAAGDGHGFVTAALAEGYGTSGACWDSVNATLVGQQGIFDQGDRMIFTGTAGAVTTRYRYPITQGLALYTGPEDTKYLKAFDGTPGNARFIGPVAQKWSDASWQWGAVVIGTKAADPAGTVLYIKAPAKAKVIDTAP